MVILTRYRWFIITKNGVFTYHPYPLPSQRPASRIVGSRPLSLAR